MFWLWPPLWSSDQSSWLQIQMPGFDSRRHQIFWELVGLERGPLSLVSTIEEMLGRKSNGPSLENREYFRRDPSRSSRDTFYLQTLALTSLTSGGRSVGTLRSRTKATELLLAIIFCLQVAGSEGTESRGYRSAGLSYLSEGQYERGRCIDEWHWDMHRYWQLFLVNGLFLKHNR
jgi:hypothetical protein